MQKKKIVIISVVVLLIILVGGYFGYKKFYKSPDAIFTNYINAVFDEGKKVINDKVLNNLDNTDNDILVNGSLSFDTNASLDDYEELKDYSLLFNMGLSPKSKLLNLKLDLLKESKNFLSGSLIMQNNHLYAKVPSILSKTIDLGTNELDEMMNVSNASFTKDDINTVIDGTKEVILNSIKKEDVKKESTKVHDEKLNLITYNFNKENQILLLNNMKNYIENNSDYEESLSNLTGNSKSKLLDSIEEQIDDYDSEDVTISLYTKGINNSFKELDIKSTTDSFINITFNDNTYTFTMPNLVMTMKDNVVNVKYTDEDTNVPYEMNLTTLAANENKIDLVIPYEDNTYNIHVTLKVSNEELKKENISNASTIDSLSVTEIEDAYQKFYDIIEGTIFEKIIINAFAGNV